MDEPSLPDAFNLSRALGHAFGAVKIAAAPLWLGGMLMSMSDCGGGRFPTGIGDVAGLIGDEKTSSSWPSPWPRAFAAYAMSEVSDAEVAGWVTGIALVGVLVLVVVIGMLLLNAWLSTGFLRMQVGVLEHGSDALAPLFSGRDRLWPMLGYKLLTSFTFSGVFIATAWPGALLAYYGFSTDSTTLGVLGIGLSVMLSVPVLIYVGLGMYLGEVAVALDGASPAQALRRSFELAARGRLTLFAFAFVGMLVEMAGSMGILLCCVGILATVPLARSIASFARTESYLLLTRGFAQTENWALWQRERALRPPPAAPAPPPAPGPRSDESS
ncbi:MAG TPA: hypothetical protein VK509_14820 [Polyangiales bacterium]|nr:hypothetical protein [Polyangiales bacterium]